MIAEFTIDTFNPVLEYLPRLVPEAALVALPRPQDTEPGSGDIDPPADPFLDAEARPSDPKQAAIVAVIDYSVPFAHPLFTTESGHSRFAAIWLMEAAAAKKTRPDIAFGRELRGPDIQALRDPGDPDAAYRSCGLMSPGRCLSMAHASSHGAAVATLAGGYRPTDQEGRQFPLLGVSLPRTVIDETSGSLSTLFIQAAVTFVIARARALARELSDEAGKPIRPPLIVNLSMGVTAGAEDASGPLTRLQDAIADGGIDDLGPIHFVVPTGNHRQDCLRARLFKGQRIGWNIPPGDPTHNAIEIWGAAGQGVPKIALETPDGARLEVPLTASGAGLVLNGQGKQVGRVVLQKRGNPSRACFTVILPPTLPAMPGDPLSPPGLWRLEILNAGDMGCDLVIHRDDRLPGFRSQALQSRLVDDGYARRTTDGRWPIADPPNANQMKTPMIRRNGTVSAYGRGGSQIRVGACQAWPAGEISAYSGLLKDGSAGDVIAPADASLSRTGMILPGIREAGRQRLSGTSLSAPQVTRWLADALASGKDIPNREAVAEALRDAEGNGQTASRLGVPELPWQHGLQD